MVNLVFSVTERFRSLKKKYVFGKSSFDISSLIHRALNVDLTVYVDREQLAICRTQCYSRIVRYKNAVQKVEEIGGEIKRNFGGDFPLVKTKGCDRPAQTPLVSCDSDAF